MSAVARVLVYITPATMIRSLIILLVLKSAVCQRNCPLTGVVTNTNGTERYEHVFNCHVPVTFTSESNVCDTACCADRCLAYGNCNSFHVTYSVPNRIPSCGYNYLGTYYYTSMNTCDWNQWLGNVRGYTRCITSCPAGEETLLGQPCTECRVGTYKNTSGAGVCTQCPKGEYTMPSKRDECHVCPKIYDAHALTDASERGMHSFNVNRKTQTNELCEFPVNFHDSA